MGRRSQKRTLRTLTSPDQKESPSYSVNLVPWVGKVKTGSQQMPIPQSEMQKPTTQPQTPFATPVPGKAIQGPQQMPIQQPVVQNPATLPWALVVTPIAGKVIPWPQVIHFPQPVVHKPATQPQTLFATRVAGKVIQWPQQMPIQQPVVQKPATQPWTPVTTPAAETGPEWMEVDSSKAAKFVSMHSNALSRVSADMWHKVIVKTPITDKHAAIHAINKRIAPLKLVPYFFGWENGCMTFLVNNCSVPLIMLCRRDLKVPDPSNEHPEIELALKLCAKKFSSSDLLQKIVSSRLDSEKKNLDLSYLDTIPEFQEMLFDTSDYSQLLPELLRIASVMAPNMVSLRLAGNALELLHSLKEVFKDHSKWKQLKILDLTYNKIRTIQELVIFHHLPITELYLDQNPICGKYTEDAYISVIRVSFPQLVKLDGTYLHHTPKLPFWRPNYILCGTYGDSGELADQFLEHFFTLYDGDDRMWLRGLYHEDAYFSLSSMYLPGQSTSSNARLTSYVMECRNLLNTYNKMRNKAAISCGAEKILEKLAKLPRTLHDPYSFTVDLTHHSAVCTVITVTGLFRDQNTPETISTRHFMRTFILMFVANDEYQIINDILYVTNATSRESEEAFRFTKPAPKTKKIRPPQPLLTESDKESMTDIVSHLTDMSASWSRKCLDETDWDIKEALQVFTELYKQDKIPEEAFDNSSKEETATT